MRPRAAHRRVVRGLRQATLLRPQGFQMGDRPFNVLFLCTRDSARTIHRRMRVPPAKGRNPCPGEALLRRRNSDTKGLRSKSWCEFATLEAPKLDFVYVRQRRIAADGTPDTWQWKRYRSRFGPAPIVMSNNVTRTGY